MPIDWKPADEERFNQAPVRKPNQKIDPDWEALLATLEDGGVAEIRYADTNERAGIARGVGRRAAGRGFRVELRYLDDEQVILVRKSDQPLKEKTARTPTNGRRRKAVEE